MSYLTTLLRSTHVKAKFSCGKPMLDDYLRQQAKQDVKAKVTACFVLSDSEKEVKGYYTLSNGSIPRSDLPGLVVKKLPRYKDLPITLLGRLAVDNKFKGQQIGTALLIDALKRSFDTAGSIGSMAVIVDPLDEDAVKFYTNYGFIMLPDSGRMFLPIATVGQLF